MPKERSARYIETYRDFDLPGGLPRLHRCGVPRSMEQERTAVFPLNTPPETVPLDRTNGALGPLKWCIATAAMVH